MENSFFSDMVFEGKNFVAPTLKKGEYANCRFVQLDLSKADLSFFEFTDCVFDHCDMSMVKLHKTSFSEVKFVHCKMLGIVFDPCNEFLFTLSFDTCILNFSSFYKRRLQKTSFSNCILHEVDFTEADLSAADFSGADLAGAKFDNTNLEKSDFLTAQHFIIDPENNKIKKAIFSIHGLPGLLNKYNIEIR